MVEVTERMAEKQIYDLIGCFTEPLVVCPGGWDDTIPDWLRKAVVTERMIELIVATREGREPTGTDAEACAYMYTASLVAPIGSDWTEIQLYLATKCLQKHQQAREIPEDIKVEELSDYRLGLLATLKRDIYRRRHRFTEDQRRVARRQDREQKQAVKERNQGIQVSFEDLLKGGENDG
jgi:hypothetical protein